MSASLLAVVAGLAGPVQAGGGAHIVDDAVVIPPGTCHVESWLTDFEPGGYFFNASPACVLEELPRLQFGAQIQSYWEESKVGLAGPALKLNLVPLAAGAALAVTFNGGVEWSTGNLDLLTSVFPVTIPVTPRVEFNLNVGFSYVREDEHPNAAFLGAQAIAEIGHGLDLMVELFRRAPGIGGFQTGLRWTPPGAEWIYFEALAGSILADESPRFFTLGVTLRSRR